MIVDANLLIYAYDRQSPFHQQARSWLEEQLNGGTRIGLPWVSLLAFARIVCHPRIYERPASPAQAWEQIELWLDAPAAWIPSVTGRHRQVLGGLITGHRLSSSLLPDAHLAALAIEHGVVVASADGDFARFSEVAWLNPIG